MSRALPPQLDRSSYTDQISLFSHFHVAPAPPSGAAAEASLNAAVRYLSQESGSAPDHHHHHHHHHQQHGCRCETGGPDNTAVSQKLSMFGRLLTVRPPSPPLPHDVLQDVHTVLAFTSRRRALTALDDVPAVPGSARLSVWKGDITKLAGVTAIVNAANSRLLGCFRPDHPCIDNAIHAAAGPRLRTDCETIVRLQGGEEPTGQVKVTRGYFLPAKFVLHTVGPIVVAGRPSQAQAAELASCYEMCLEAAEALPADGGASLAFCCISTGMFGYPADQAADVAIAAVAAYFRTNPASQIRRVVFNVFTETDLALYASRLSPSAPLVQPAPPLPPTVATAIRLLSSADALLVTAGAGMSASCGLDCTSRGLFSERFPGAASRGPRCLYDAFGYSFADELDRWGCFFSHGSTVFSCALGESDAYTHVKALVSRFDDDAWFVRTSNADGMFLRHGFPAERLSTPQGDYQFVQCISRCRPESVFATMPFLERARPHLDERRQALRSPAAVPACPHCGGAMSLCVRADASFNDRPFREGNRRYREFLARIAAGQRAKLVVLEIGVGRKTPAALRQPDEELVENGHAAAIVRIGLAGAQEVPWTMVGGEGEPVRAVGIEGDATWVLRAIVEGLGNIA